MNKLSGYAFKYRILFAFLWGVLWIVPLTEIQAQHPPKEGSIGVGSFVVNHSNRTLCYFVFHGKDTSRFKCQITESPSGQIGIRIWFDPSLSYRLQYSELLAILKKAQSDFQLGSLRSIMIGRLYTTGDLAVEITKQYLSKYKKYPSSIVNKDIALFLINSKLVDDFNALFTPYKVEVRQVEVEKAFFAEKKYLYSVSQIETDPARIPEKVLDSMIMIKVW